MSSFRKLDYLLLPMQPTPNGRLHIGHASGPYLRADALARSLRRAGHQASIITGSDAFENWVFLDGINSGRSPAETCRHFQALIKRDLENAQIEIETWIDPLFNEDYRRIHENLLEDLIASRQVSLETEHVPISALTGREVIGTWILGTCPTCGKPCGGNTCVHCGDHFQPEEVIEPRSRLDEGPLNWVEKKNWFLTPADPDAVLRSLHTTGIDEQFVTAPANYVAKHKGRVRLSHVGDWGVASRHAPDGAVLSNTYYAYCLYCGQVYADSRGIDKHPLAKDSDTVVVGLFGKDNSIAGLVAPYAIGLASSQFRPFDHVVVNHMLYFEGRKCSTSKAHGIWVSELLEGSSVTSDELRYCLAHAALDNDIADVTLTRLLKNVNALRIWQREKLVPVQSSAGGKWSTPLLERLWDVLKVQSTVLQPDHVRMHVAVSVLDDWIFDRRLDLREPDVASSWLAGTAMLAEPIMPSFAASLWTWLGLPGRPHMSGLEAAPRLTRPAFSPMMEELTEGEIRPYCHYEREWQPDRKPLTPPVQ